MVGESHADPELPLFFISGRTRITGRENQESGIFVRSKAMRDTTLKRENLSRPPIASTRVSEESDMVGNRVNSHRLLCSVFRNI